MNCSIKILQNLIKRPNGESTSKSATPREYKSCYYSAASGRDFPCLYVSFLYPHKIPSVTHRIGGMLWGAQDREIQKLAMFLFHTHCLPA
jgi:hypothetical protein